MDVDELMGNQAENPGLVTAATVANPPVLQNGSAVEAPVVAPTAATVDAPLMAVEKAPPPHIDKDLTSPELFLNRELTWLAFNRRVFAEALDESNPLLERVKFLAITASNLDEFFMKRIGGLKQQAIAGMQELTDDGRTPQQQIAECLAEVRSFEAEQRALLPELLKRLRDSDIDILYFEQLSPAEQATIREHYLRNIFPLMTPQAMDPAHPFPFISNLSLNLLVTLRAPDDTEPSLARVKVPVGLGIPRFLRVDGTRRFVRLEDVVAHNLDLLFPEAKIDGYEFFRVTRNANTERDEDEADDLLALIESELRDRRFAPIVRMEALAGMNPVHRGMLAAELGLDERDDVFEIVDGMLAMRDLMD
jgi:polyphosphate kinase